MSYKKVVFIHLFNDRSGSPKVLSQSIQALHEKHIEVELITSHHKDGFLSNLPVPTYHLFYKRTENKFVTLAYYLFSQVYLFAICLRYWNKDVVFYINTLMPFGAALSAKLMRKRVVYHIHETSIKPKILKYFLKKMVSYTATKIVYVSEFLSTLEGIKGKDSCVVYNALEETFLKKSRIQFEKPDKEHLFTVLMVCSLKKYKGVDEFIELSNRMEVHKNIKFNLVLNASDDEVSKYFFKVNLAKNIEVFSRKLDLVPFYREADVLLNLSRPDEWIETFGLTLIEGMSFGLPVICPEVGGPVEVVRDQVDGFHISCYKLDKVISKTLDLSNNKELYNKMSLNAKKRVIYFSEQCFKDHLLECIEDVLH